MVWIQIRTDTVGPELGPNGCQRLSADNKIVISKERVNGKQCKPRLDHKQIQKVLSEGVQFCQCFFFFFEGDLERIQIPLKAGHYGPAREIPLKWRLAGGTTMAQHTTLNAALKAF